MTDDIDDGTDLAGPLIRHGDPPPGGYEPDPERPNLLRPWGETCWRVAHGPAVVHWSFGSPNRAVNALLPDGRRGDVGNLGALAGRPDSQWRRRRGGRFDGWIWGDLRLSGDDAVFVDADPQPSPSPRGCRAEGQPDMGLDILGSPEAASAAADGGFAQALYAAMCNRQWRRADGTGERWACSWRGAGGIVAELRGRGEIYVDWYCSGISDVDLEPADAPPPAAERPVPEGTVRDDVRDLLGRLGWRPVTDEEVAADHAAATARIRELEALPPGGRPAWYRVPGAPARRHRRGRPWSDRLHDLAATGRVSEPEFDAITDRLDLSRNDADPAGSTEAGTGDPEGSPGGA